MRSSTFRGESGARPRGMTREESESALLEEPYPRVLNTLNSSGPFHKVSPDKKTIRYVGSAPYGDNDVGAVQADAPVPTQRIAYYFEMTVKNSGEHGWTAIGFTCKDYNLRRQPGWDANSCGYHGDNGHIYYGPGKAEPFGPTFTSGDTVGAGINYDSDEFFFTKNGRLVGTLPKNIKGPLYPTVAVHSRNEEVTVNFGEKQFLFDIKVHLGFERQTSRSTLEESGTTCGGSMPEEWESVLPEELYPRALNTLNSSGPFHKVSLDKKTVCYVGSAPYGDNDVGAVQADAPVPIQRIAYYFEMTVKNSGEHGYTSIGFTCKDYNLRRQPGWDANSCGYHGDNGHIYYGPGKAEPFGPAFTSGDTVGAGINYASDEFFFTKNGKLVGTLRKMIKGPLYPTVAVHSQNEEVTVNFGEKQFLFDIKVHLDFELQTSRSTLEEMSYSFHGESGASSGGMMREVLREESYPRVLNTLNSSGPFHKVSLDKKTVRYVGSAPYSNDDVGAVQADAPVPTQRIAYYFEMTVKNSGEHGYTSIGFTCKDYNLRRQPGWDANSCGYHGDNGHIYYGPGKAEPFGPAFTSGDTVGAGIDYASDEFFFTKNGKLVGTLHKNIEGPLYPTVAVHSQNEEVSVNFGDKQFLFDIKVNEGVPCPDQFDLHQNDGADLGRMSIQVEFGEGMQQESSSTNEEGAHVTSQDCLMEEVGECLQVENPASEVEENLETTFSEYQESATGKAGGLIIHSSVGKIDLRNLQEMDIKDLVELKELGSGGFGTVYHGKWRGVDVAIKRMTKSSIVGQQSGQYKLILESLREAGILSKVQHPNVVSLYGFTLDKLSSTLAIVMELVGGGSLRNFLHHEKYLDHCKKLTLAKDAAFGMEYLHLKNIVHFDLKSDNLLVDLKDPSRPTCKVTDFGLSKIKENTLVSGNFRGTLPWMAPELLKRGNNKVSEKVDVYSFGIVMWEILTGQVPYSGMDVGGIIGGIYDNTLRPPVPASCDPEWRELMEQCWAVNPQERPSFGEIARRLHLMSLVSHAEASK